MSRYELRNYRDESIIKGKIYLLAFGQVLCFSIVTAHDALEFGSKI